MTKLLRCLRLDASDTFVFEQAAAPGEWAVPGSFMFWDEDVALLAGKRRQAFRAGFLGLESFGWSTLAVVVEASAEERAAAVSALAAFLLDHHGAPDEASARRAGEEEIAFAESLAAHPEQTVVALHRAVGQDGEIMEQFRTLHRAESPAGDGLPCSAGAFFAVAAEEEEAGGEVDIHDLLKARGKGAAAETG